MSATSTAKRSRTSGGSRAADAAAAKLGVSVSSPPSDQLAADAALAALLTTPRRPMTRGAAAASEGSAGAASAAAANAAAAAAPVTAAAAPTASNRPKRKHVSVSYDERADSMTAAAGGDGDDVGMPDLEGAAADSTAAASSSAGVSPPANWERVYAGIEEMRYHPGGLAWQAPVDTVGCSQLAHPDADEKTKRYHVLVSLMLSSQTKDPVTAAAMQNLHTHWPDGLTVANMLAIDPHTLDSLIGKVGFHNRKTVYLQQTAAILRDQYASDIPDSLSGLMSLPGVGPKMAHLVMQVAWRNTVGIGVDTHVHRISNRLGWVGKRPTQTPEQTRMALERWLPREYWGVVNLLLVGFGQKVCLPIGPRCRDCRVNSLCPTGRTNLRYVKDDNKFHEVPQFSGTHRRMEEEMVGAQKQVEAEGDSAPAAAAAAASSASSSVGVKLEDEPVAGAASSSDAARVSMLAAGIPPSDTAAVKREPVAEDTQVKQERSESASADHSSSSGSSSSTTRASSSFLSRQHK